MSRKTVQVLVGIVTALLLLLLAVDRNGDDDSENRRVLLPGFKGLANEATRVTVSRAVGEEGVTLHREGRRWVVSARDGYPADVGKLGQLIDALAAARILEEKTSNPDNYSKLGVDDPGQGGKGDLVTIVGTDFSYSVILGNSAQRDFRYARTPEQAASYLIDRNPPVPDSAGEWLLQDLIDIPSDRIQRVTVAHADGETIVIEKTDPEQTDFAVIDVPSERELSYATVGNGMAGALAGLKLDDVRKRAGTPAASSAAFETWDGLKIAVDVTVEDEAAWLAFTAATADGESAAANEAAEIDERLSGWQYRVPDHRKNLLIRRWDDILKSADAD
ncbi:MAG: DUF4340 domain-containing protein [Proteobacteria bacterium]|nr:DUF4340 domain-containing protein [Pseudomonadota bacterium]